MDNIPIISLLFYSIPESILIFSFGYVIWRNPIKWVPTLLSAIISVSLCYFIRKLPLPFGIHTLLGVVIIFVLFKFVNNFSIRKGIIASFLSLASLLFLENTVLYSIQLTFNLSLTKIHNLPEWERTLIGYPQLIVWCCIMILMNKYRVPILGVPTDESEN